MAKPKNRGAWDYFWPFGSRRYNLRTSLTPEQCWEKLKLHVAAEAGGRVSFPIYDDIIGWFHATGFTIRRAAGIIVTPCPTVASGKITRTEGGSRLTIRVAMEETGLILVCLWLLGWLVFFFAFPLAFWAGWLLGYGMLVSSRWLGRDDGPLLIWFLCEVLKAEEEAD